MKYFAILKDSFREAIDFKIFYVLIGLALLAILLVASLSFETATPDEVFREKVERGSFRQVRAERGRNRMIGDFARAEFDLVDIKPTSQASRPEERDYELKIRVTDTQPFGFWNTVQFWSREDPGMPINLNEPPKRPDAETIEAFFVGQFENNGINASSVKLANATEPTEEEPKGSYTYIVRTKGEENVRNWPKTVSLLFGLIELPMNISVGMVVYVIEDGLIGGLGATVALVISVIVTAFFIPNMLRKGTVDVLIAKPVNRTTLLIFKYLGGLTFMFLITAFTIGGVWLVLGLRSGIWAPGFLLSIFLLTFFFAVLYAISTLFAVLTRSTIASILLTIFVWFLFWIVGVVHGTIDLFYRHSDTHISPALHATTGTLKDVAPTVNLGELNSRIVAQSVLTESDQRMMMLDRQPEIDRVKSVLVPCLWIAAMLSLACWRFTVRDF